ncbi:MAG TPA: hypothetical protein PL010_14760 [Flavobacteriales bacterium]|nr:hypothetical protein [Flavobacteriales bacterium]HNI05882.1 hypothetical protein [Flavobacteriales bacterium]HNK70148.1 hypothetical protein [Flavobacteriales bacterium]HNO05843.1 hypothetical protein [Flavobacteriales bacterium]
MSAAYNTWHLTAELTVQELYIVLGYAWYMSATSTGDVMAAHNRVAQAAKSALVAAGETHERIYSKLEAIMLEMEIRPSE